MYYYCHNIKSQSSMYMCEPFVAKTLANYNTTEHDFETKQCIYHMPWSKTQTQIVKSNIKWHTRPSERIKWEK